MFDIGFTEIIIIGIVSLVVIGPERLPGAIRTGSTWLRRIKRGFNDIKREVEQELHNDSVLQDLKQTGADLSNEVNSIGGEIRNVTEPLQQSITGESAEPPTPTPDSGSEPGKAPE